MSTLRIAHLQADLAPKLASRISEPTLALRELAAWHAERVHALLNTEVFTNRVQLHSPPCPAAPDDARALALVEQSRLTAVGAESDVLDESAVFGQLRLHRRLDAAEILLALYDIEDEMRQRYAELAGTAVDRHDMEATRASLNDTEPYAAQVVASDMDGVLAVLKAQNAAKTGPLSFRDTKLGAAVQRNAEVFEGELRALTGGDAAADGQDTEMGLLPFFVRKYGPLMEGCWGEEAKRRIREIFSEAYADEVFALQAAERHIASMPLAYHVFRHKTWDHRFEDVYEMDTRGGEFAAEVVERGGRLLFVTAAPKIHALKMLKASGVMHAVGQNGFELYAMEDMYEPGTVENGTYVEGDKGTLLQAWAERNGVAAQDIVMGGDQYHSDVEPAIAKGMHARVVRGPEGLERYAKSVRLPRDERVAKSHS